MRVFPGPPPARPATCLSVQATSNARRFKSAALEFGWKNSGDKEEEEKEEGRASKPNSIFPQLCSGDDAVLLLFAKVPRRGRSHHNEKADMT